jgi:peptidyl-prolyl cis-trans isomerase SurA
MNGGATERRSEMMPLIATGLRMRDIRQVAGMPLTGVSVRGVAATLLVAGALLVASQPHAQAQVVAVVGGEPITQVDIQQRTKLIQLSTQKTPSRQEVLDELIDDKLKVQLSKRYIAEVPKREIESAYAGIARRAGMTVAQFTKMTAASGISPEALKSRIHADFVWSQIVRGKFQGSLQVGEKDVEVKLQASNKEGPAGYEFKLRPVLFLVPKGAAATVFEARKRDAEALRGRFTSCDEGLRIAMTLPDVVVRETIMRQLADLGQAQRDVLNNTPVGRLTPPDVTQQGVEVFAVCSKVPAVGSDSPARRQVRDEMFNERYQALSKKFLKELRSQALIEYK